MMIIERKRFDAQYKTNLSTVRKIGKRNHQGLVSPKRLKKRTKDEAANQRAGKNKGLVAETIK